MVDRIGGPPPPFMGGGEVSGTWMQAFVNSLRQAAKDVEYGGTISDSAAQGLQFSWGAMSEKQQNDALQAAEGAVPEIKDMNGDLLARINTIATNPLTEWASDSLNTIANALSQL